MGYFSVFLNLARWQDTVISGDGVKGELSAFDSLIGVIMSSIYLHLLDGELVDRVLYSVGEHSATVVSAR